MAIEFNCPYCTAAIRVPDTAAGKRGTCPKCATKLLVPAIEIPEANDVPKPIPSTSEAPNTSDVAPPSEFTSTTGPVDMPPVALNSIAGENSIPIVKTSPQAGRPGRKKKKRRPRGRRRNSGLWILMPLAAVALLVAVLLFVFYQPPLKLEGMLTGTRISAVNIAPGKLNANDVDVSADEFARAVESLTAAPLILTSQLVRTEISGSEDSIVVDINMTSTAEFVSVDISDPALKQFISDNAVTFGQQKLHRLRTSATQLVKELSQDGERRLTNPSTLRNAVALNLLRNGFGFVIDGQSGTLLCPCVYESGNQVWFAVPAGTTSFLLRGRTIDGLGQQFTGRYQVNVNADAETVTVEPIEEDFPEEPTPADDAPAEPTMDVDTGDVPE